MKQGLVYIFPGISQALVYIFQQMILFRWFKWSISQAHIRYVVEIVLINFLLLVYCQFAFYVCPTSIIDFVLGYVNFSVKLHPDRGELIADSTMEVPENLNTCTHQKEFSADLQTNGNQNTCLICSLGGKLLWVTFSSGFSLLQMSLVDDMEILFYAFFQEKQIL